MGPSTTISEKMIFVRFFEAAKPSRPAGLHVVSSPRNAGGGFEAGEQQELSFGQIPAGQGAEKMSRDEVPMTPWQKAL